MEEEVQKIHDNAVEQTLFESITSILEGYDAKTQNKILTQCRDYFEQRNRAPWPTLSRR